MKNRKRMKNYQVIIGSTHRGKERFAIDWNEKKQKFVRIKTAVSTGKEYPAYVFLYVNEKKPEYENKTVRHHNGLKKKKFMANKRKTLKDTHFIIDWIKMEEECELLH